MKQAKQLPAAFGNTSISQGDISTELSIQRYMRFVERYEPKLAQQLNKKYKGELNDDWFGDLVHILDEMAPKDCYFGPMPSDMNNVGFWRTVDGETIPEGC